MSRIERLIERRASLWEAMKTHLDTVEAAGDELTGEAEATWQRQNSELAELDAQINAEHDLEQRNAKAELVKSQYAKVPETDWQRESDDARFRALARGEVRSVDFGTLESRALTVGSATAGGDVVPTGFYPRLVQHMIENSAIRQTNVTVLETAGGGDLQIPKTTAFSTASIVSEGGTIPESDPTFGQITLKAYKYGFLVQVSSELLEDAGVDLTGFLAQQAGRALGNGPGTHFITGSGSSQPKGVVTAATTGVTGATGAVGAPTADNLVDLFFSVIAPYRRNGTWLVSDQGMAAIRKLRTNVGGAGTGEYLWAPGLVPGEQSTLLGRPVVVDPNVAAPALSAKSVVFGDLSAYFIRDVAGVRVEVSREFAFDTDLVTFRFLVRTDGNLVDTTGAVKVFVGGAS